MVVLLTGATGFLGRRLVKALLAARHDVVCAVRRIPDYTPPPGCRFVLSDFSTDSDPKAWLPKLSNVDVVINAAGILRENRTQQFITIHTLAPKALFAASAQAGVRRVIQISALGADDEAQSRYHLSKREADEFLATLPIDSLIVQPSLIYGPEGTSARFFTTLAALPIVGLPSGGCQMIQPIHADEVTEAIVRLLGAQTVAGTRIPMVGPEAMTLHVFLSKLRAGMGLGKLRVIALPPGLVRLAARAAGLLQGSLLDSETLDMLERGNTGDPTPMHRLLGRPARPAAAFIASSDSQAVRLQAQLNWLLPVLRIAIALVWIVTGILSLGVYPIAESYALLERVGVSGAFAPVMLYGAAVSDLVLGFATLLAKRRHWLWMTQIALILFYTALITLRLPEFWLHPYGPILKNLPMLAAIWLLMELERR